jgi:hypothetical protein
MRLLAFLSLVFAAPAAADEFVPGFTDLPLMPGLTAVDPAPVIFDKPGGRIVETAARGASPSTVAEFYRATLPQLGWTPAPGGGYDALAYRRDDEMLRIEMGRDGIVRFLLSPR